MKFLLTALNSKYMHTALAVRSLHGYLKKQGINAPFLEFTINDRMEDVCEVLVSKQADVYCFSVYIWNYKAVLELAERVKLVMPRAMIVLGGPEVSFTPEETIRAYPFVDCIVSGEGEKPLFRLFQALKDERGFCDIPGVAYRLGQEIAVNQREGSGISLDELPFPYEPADLKKNAHKLLYYESSRGCPYGCSYCISSQLEPVKYRSLPLVKRDLNRFFRADVFTIKFVDRTFNADRKRAIAILEHCNRYSRGTKVHFEIYPDLINEEFLSCCRALRPGIFQFEIGIQTTNPKTLAEIGRKSNVDSFDILKRLISFGNIEIHLDLIALLPYETLASYKKAFNQVYALHPHVMQPGFLKLLKGTQMREKAGQYGFRYRDEPPYEVLESYAMPYREARRVKAMDRGIDLYYNSGLFCHTLSYLDPWIDPFDFYSGLSRFIQKENSEFAKSNEEKKSEFLYRYILKTMTGYVSERQVSTCLKLDYFLKFGNKKRLAFLAYDAPLSPGQICTYLAAHAGTLKIIPPAERMKKPQYLMKFIHFISLDFGIKRFFAVDVRSGQFCEILDF